MSRQGRVFLTGATGFIGSHVLRELLGLDDEAIAELEAAGVLAAERPSDARAPA